MHEYAELRVSVQAYHEVGADSRVEPTFEASPASLVPEEDTSVGGNDMRMFMDGMYE